MIGKLAQEYILFVISTIRDSYGAGMVDNEMGGSALDCLAVAHGELLAGRLLSPLWGWKVLEAPCPRAYALGYLLPSLREGCRDPNVHAVPGFKGGTWSTRLHGHC